MSTCPNCAAATPPGGVCPRCTSAYASFNQPETAQQTYPPQPPAGYVTTTNQTYAPSSHFQHAYAPPPPWGGQWQGYGYQPTAPAKSSKAITGLVLGIIGLFILPIILCPIGIALGMQAQKRGDPRGRTAVIVSSVCLAAGIVLGVIVNSALKNQ